VQQLIKKILNSSFVWHATTATTRCSRTKIKKKKIQKLRQQHKRLNYGCCESSKKLSPENPKKSYDGVDGPRRTGGGNGDGDGGRSLIKLPLQ
jgi:hypothetical protein